MIPRPLTVQTLRRAEDLPAHEHAKCSCGQYYTFATDRLGRTLEVCHRCNTRQLISGRSAPALKPSARAVPVLAADAPDRARFGPRWKQCQVHGQRLITLIPPSEAEALTAADLSRAAALPSWSIYAALSYLAKKQLVHRKKIKVAGKRGGTFTYWKAA